MKGREVGDLGDQGGAPGTVDSNVVQEVVSTLTGMVPGRSLPVSPRLDGRRSWLFRFEHFDIPRLKFRTGG